MYAIEKGRKFSHGFKSRMIIKTFKTSDAMHKFLCGKDNYSNQWTISELGLKAGTYAYAGGKWHNVKSLDPSVLAHI